MLPGTCTCSPSPRPYSSQLSDSALQLLKLRLPHCSTGPALQLTKLLIVFFLPGRLRAAPARRVQWIAAPALRILLYSSWRSAPPIQALLHSSSSPDPPSATGPPLQLSRLCSRAPCYQGRPAPARRHRGPAASSSQIQLYSSSSSGSPTALQALLYSSPSS